MTNTIYINFDMDGTIADFYNVPHWLEAIRALIPTPTKWRALCSIAPG